MSLRAPILVEAKANGHWSLDFVRDQFACGRRFRILNVVDDEASRFRRLLPSRHLTHQKPPTLYSQPDETPVVGHLGRKLNIRIYFGLEVRNL